MEKHISQFRSLEIQISEDDMKFGDKLPYFVAPFSTELKRRIVLENARRMEIAYDSALEYANAYQETQDERTPTDSAPEKTAEALLNDPTIATVLAAFLKREKSSKDSDDSAKTPAYDVDLDMMVNTDPTEPRHHAFMAIQMDSIICYRCNKRGHYARRCTSPKPSTDPPTSSDDRNPPASGNHGKNVRFRPATKDERMYLISDWDDVPENYEERPAGLSCIDDDHYGEGDLSQFLHEREKLWTVDDDDDVGFANVKSGCIFNHRDEEAVARCIFQH
jgi:hypothetical protein